MNAKWMQVSDSLTNEQTPGTDTYTATDRLNSISFGFTDASGYVMNGFETLEGIQKSLLASKDLAGYMLADANVCGGGAANDTGTWYTAMFVFAEEREVWQAFEFTCNESTSQGIVPHQQS
ncbi:hypothetical protein GGF46_002519 [Coemansia sp. RSA 552]|nr:hypothetical protein GGF46_002519 [Coemansia sp. RSA 552]